MFYFSVLGMMEVPRARVHRLGGWILEDFKGVDVVEKDGRPEELVRPPTRDAFGGVVCWEGDVWGKFLGARDKEELMVNSAEDASSVGVDEYVYDL